MAAGRCACCAASIRQPTLPPPPRAPTPPQDVHHSVFALLRAQGAAAPAQLLAALCEYLGSAQARGLGAAPCLATLCVDCLLDQVGRGWALSGSGGRACSGASGACWSRRAAATATAGADASLTARPAPLAQGLPHLVAPLLLSLPQLDSALLAEHLVEAAAAGRLPGGAACQLAEQLLLRLGAHEARCRLLLRRGAARRALALARQERLVGALAPEALLEAAAASGDALLYAAAHRVCSIAAPRPGGRPGAGLAEALEAHRSRFAPVQLAILQASAQ